MREVDTKPVRARRPFRRFDSDTRRHAGPVAALFFAVLRIRNSGVGSWRSLVVLLAVLGVLFLVLALLISQGATAGLEIARRP
jgi:hypothetical protein